MEKTTTFMRRGFLAGLIAVCACTLCFALTACGPSDEDQAKEALDNELSQLVNPSDENMEKLISEFESSGGSDLAMMNVDSTTFIESWLSGFSYTIDDVTVDGTTAKAKTTVTCKQLYAVATAWSNSLESDLMSQNFTSVSEAYTYAGKTLVDYIDSADTVTTQVTFTLEKDGGTWKYVDGTENDQALVDCLFGGGADVSLLEG